MAVVLVPDFRGELVEDFAGRIAIFPFETVDPDDRLMPFFRGKRESTLFKLCETHRRALHCLWKLPIATRAFCCGNCWNTLVASF
jgi:hypothetical protein